MKSNNLNLISSYFLKFVFSFFLTINLTSCSSWQGLSPAKNVEEIKIYFTKSKGPEDVLFIPVTRKIPKDESVVDNSLKELFLGPTKNEELRGIMTEIPVGTRLIKIEESEDEILIDVSAQYLTGGGSASMQLRYLQLYKTLKNVAPGKRIYLQIDGKKLKTIGGEGLEVEQPLEGINDYTKKPKDIDELQP